MLDTTPLRNAYGTLLDAAATVADSGDPVPPPGEWNADQNLAHVVLINTATIAAVSSAATSMVTTYDNRLAQDPWTLDRVITLATATRGSGSASPFKQKPCAPWEQCSAKPNSTHRCPPCCCRTAKSDSTSPRRSATSSTASQNWNSPATPNNSWPSYQHTPRPNPRCDLSGVHRRKPVQLPWPAHAVGAHIPNGDRHRAGRLGRFDG